MSRFTKLVVIGSNLLAIWLLARLVSRGIPRILVPSILAFGVSWLSAVLAGEIVTTVILALVYFVPALCIAWFDNFIFSYYAIWLAALCGSMLPRSFLSEWAFPRPFNFPLVLWALVLALSWPIVLLREIDFAPGLPGLLQPETFSNLRVPKSPLIIAVWVLNVTSIAITGLLLLDWLFVAHPVNGAQGSTGAHRFERRIIWPLIAAAGVAGAVGAYQTLVDMSFPTSSYFGSLGRAIGTMLDANAFGAVMAMWLPLSAALIVGAGRKTSRRTSLGILLFTVLGVALWGSGSRTALLAALIGLAVLVSCVRRSVSTHQAVVGLAGVAALIAAIAFVGPVSTGPWQRLVAFADMMEAQGFPMDSIEGLKYSARYLWRRDLYGTVAERMIGRHPMVGIGIGGFNFQVGDEIYAMNESHRRPDNAQNWYRHQLAELGLIGSAAWIVWLGMFFWVLVRRHGPPERRAMVGAAKGALIGLAVASLLGMPTQDTAASITFIVLACWCLKLTGSESAPEPAASPRLTRNEWIAILVVLGCFLGGTAYAGWTELRPPLRALRVDFPYRYGFTPDGQNPEFRWTAAKAVDVIPRERRWLKLVIGAVAPDAAANPVQVRVRLNRRLILRVNRRGDFPIVRWIRMPDDKKYVMIEIEAGRTWRPSEFGQTGVEGERGVAVANWVFSDEDPPKGSVILE